MKNTFGNNLTITLFGESHGTAIGAVLDGITPGLSVNQENIKKMLKLRSGLSEISTPRREADEIEILSGIFEGKTTGTPLCIMIKNADTRSGDYQKTKDLARPSHADFTANEKYLGFQDYRGGGHFSGRITAPIVALGSILIDALKEKGIYIGSHITKIGDLEDRKFQDIKADLEELGDKEFAVLDNSVSKKMIEKIKTAKQEGDSLGGLLETAVIGCPEGVGEPWFDSMESMLSHALFSVPAVKGVEFGAGFEFSNMTGSVANDNFKMEKGEIVTETNNSGGINGGITNGMPIIFRTAFRPTPTISKPQNTVNMATKENAVLEAKGRHDPFIVHRAKVVVDSITAITIADMLITRFGTDWLGK